MVQRSRAGCGGPSTDATFTHPQEKQLKRVIDVPRCRLLKEPHPRCCSDAHRNPTDERCRRGRSAVRPADDHTANELKDVSDASKSTDPKSGSKYANCTFYQGSAGSAQGGARKFPARQ